MATNCNIKCKNDAVVRSMTYQDEGTDYSLVSNVHQSTWQKNRSEENLISL